VVIAGQVLERPMPWPPVASPTADSEPADDRVQLPALAIGYALAGFVVGIVGGIVLAVIGNALGLPDIGILILNLIGLWTGLLGSCWLASRRWGTGHVARDFGLRIQGADAGYGALMSLAARFAGGIVVIPFLFGPRRLLENNAETYGKVTDSWGPFLVFALIAVIGAPIVEELFFRGLLLRALTGRLGVPAAIAVQAVLFGVAHFSPLLGIANFTVMAVIAAAGVIFGITAAWRRTGTSVVAHSAFNLVAVLAAAALNFG